MRPEQASFAGQPTGEEASQIFGILRDFAHSCAIQHLKECFARFVEQTLESTAPCDQAGVRVHVEALHQLKIFRVSHNVTHPHVWRVLCQTHPTTPAAGANKPSCLGQILGHLREMVQRNAESLSHFASGGLMIWVAHQE